jgi:DNA-binding transcriptional MerR regulator
MTVLLAFTVEQASRVTGVSERRIRYWDRTGVLSPSLARDTDRKHAYSRIYSFRDVVGLKTLGQLRDQFSLPL